MKVFYFIFSISLLFGTAWAYHSPRNVVLIILFIVVFGLQIAINIFLAVFYYYTKNIKYTEHIGFLKVILLATIFFLLLGSMCGGTIESLLFHHRLW